MITNSFIYHKDIEFSLEQLKFAFGFKRMAGEEILLRQLFSSKTEEQLQTLPREELIKNVAAWCKDENIRYYYDFQRDAIIFR